MKFHGFHLILFVSECNCFSHSDVCVYDEAVARVNGSLNAREEYVGGGVCQDCQNFTAGKLTSEMHQNNMNRIDSIKCHLLF